MINYGPSLRVVQTSSHSVSEEREQQCENVHAPGLYNHVDTIEDLQLGLWQTFLFLLFGAPRKFCGRDGAGLVNDIDPLYNAYHWLQIAALCIRKNNRVTPTGHKLRLFEKKIIVLPPLVTNCNSAPHIIRSPR